MALTLGTNVGFVTVAPTADPAGTGATSDGSSFVVKDTAPTGAIKITEVGWYKSGGTTSSNTQMGLYSDNAGVADVRLQVTGDQASGTSADVWIRFTGLDWAITAGTAYWIGMQQDAHTGSSTCDTAASGGSGIDTRTSQTALTDPYGGGAVSDADGMYAFYAVYQSAPTVALNTPTDTATGQSTTPALNFTGTDAQSNDIRYNVQVDTVSPPTNYLSLEDDFNDNSINATKWNSITSSSGTNSETGGRARNTPAASTIDSEGKFESVTTNYNFTGKAVVVQLVTLPTNGVHAQFFVDNGTNNIFMQWQSGTLIAGNNLGAGEVTLASIAYNASTTNWWRMRESGGTTYWDYSGDGKNWTNLWNAANPISITSVKFDIGGYESSSIGSPGYVEWDNFNIFPASINATSGTDAGFSGSPDNTDPFTSGQAVDYTVQSALSASTTYYWRARGIDPSGTNTYGAWATTRSFTTESSGASVNVSDSSTATEVISATGLTRLSVIDTSTATESVTARLSRYNASISDSSTATESINFTGIIRISVSDSSTATENLTLTGRSNLSMSDGSTATENILFTGVIRTLVSDTTTATDVPTVSEISGTYLINVSDSSTATESITITGLSRVSVSDSSTVTENILTRGLIRLEMDMDEGDTVNIGENIQFTLLNRLSLADSSSTVDSPSISETTGTYLINISDSSTINESIGFTGISRAGVSDTSTVGESALLYGINYLNLSDSSSVLEVITATSINYLNISDSVSVGESVTTVLQSGNLIVNTSDSTTVIESISLERTTFVYDIQVSDSCSVTENINTNTRSYLSVVDISTVGEDIAFKGSGYVYLSETETAQENLNTTSLSRILIVDFSVAVESITAFVPILSISVAEVESVTENINTIIPYLSAIVLDNSSVGESIVVLVPTLNVSIVESSLVGENFNILYPYLNLSLVESESVSERIRIELTKVPWFTRNNTKISGCKQVDNWNTKNSTNFQQDGNTQWYNKDNNSWKT